MLFESWWEELVNANYTGPKMQNEERVAKLFVHRQRGNYGDYKLTREDILPMVNEAKEFKKIVLDLLKQAGYKTNNES